MSTRWLEILMAVAMLGLSSCGARRESGPAVPGSQASADWRDVVFRLDDPRWSEDQRRAIRAAMKAVIGTDQPTASEADRLHFSCSESADGWSLTVWEFGPNEVPALGGFTGVTLNRDFSVRSVMGGA
jgi:hypothetical protein